MHFGLITERNRVSLSYYISQSIVHSFYKISGTGVPLLADQIQFGPAVNLRGNIVYIAPKNDS